MIRFLKNTYLSLRRSILPSPLIEIHISEKAIIDNFNKFKQHYNTDFVPVLKSNAYGHGTAQIAKILENERFPFYVVDSLFEARIIRAEGIKKQILILGYATIDQINFPLKNIIYTIITLEQLKSIASELSRPKRFHLKIDTGMHRQGIFSSEVDRAIKLIISNRNIILDGLCSHFADADGQDEEATISQIKIWNEVIKKLSRVFPRIRFKHITATAGSRYINKINANLCRTGIGMYGFAQHPSQNKLKLTPALSMYSSVTLVKKVAKAGGVGYNFTYRPKRDTKVAIVPVGYCEGLDRRLSNNGWLKIGKITYPIAGKVCMNMVALDIGMRSNIKAGDKAEVISDNPEDKNSLTTMAKVCQTIPHELMVKIPQHLKRIVVE